MTRGNILTEEEIARLAALPEKQRDYAVKIYAAREKKKSTAYILWLFFAVFYPILPDLAANALLLRADPFDPESQLRQAQLALWISRLSPNTLYAEALTALLNPAVRSLGPILITHLEGAVLGTPLPLSQSVLLVWPQITGLLALTLLLFTGAYVAFQRQEVRA